MAKQKITESASRAAGNKKLKVLFVTPEVMPFASTGGLGEVAGSLPKALCGIGIDCRVIMPLYSKIEQKYRDKMKFIGKTTVPVTWRRQYMGLFELSIDGVKYYFTDNEYYFKRDGLYGHYDDGERFSFFSRAVFEALDLMKFKPDIIHANDWQTALVPVFQNSLVRREYVKTVFTIHNVEYQGRFSRETLHSIIGLPAGEEHVLEYGEGINLMKGAIETANAVTTVSPSYAEELKDPANAFGLDAIIRRNGHKLRGIINGINTVSYDPSKDKYIASNYSASDLSGKSACKKALQTMTGLPVKNVPVITLISRLVPAKGMDLIRDVMDHILSTNDVQFVMLGTGYPEYEDFFRGLQLRHPDKAVCMIEFNTATAHRIYAGGNILLVPSRSEPCGLTQMIGCRYANIPVVRKTGGLGDTITDCTLGDGSGFVFRDFDPAELYASIMNAVDRCGDNEDWHRLEAHDMSLDFSWSSPAEKYAELYRDLTKQ